MKIRSTNSILPRRAFTLIELLVVIAIIGILAALLFPAGAAVKNKATRNRAKVELKFIEDAINSYKAQYGHFPPDNSADTNTWVSQLYYELMGSKFDNTTYQPTSGGGALLVANFNSFFGVGNKVGGFINATKGGGEDSPVARNYLTGLKPAQYLLIRNGGVDGMVLGTIIKGPLMLSDASAANFINPIRYSLSGPNRHNPDGFDLWVDILIAGKTNRINNWSADYEIVP